jgi:glutamate racemase
VANSLADYLQRHPEMEQRCSKNSTLDSGGPEIPAVRFCTTDSAGDFDDHAGIFYGKTLRSEHIVLP